MRLLRYAAVAAAVIWVAGCSGPNADEHFAKGNAYADSRQYREAIVEYKIALQADPRRGDVLLKLGDADMKVGDLRAAIGDYVRAADVLAGSLEAQVKAGSMLLLAEKFEDAKVRADNALQIDPKNVDAIILMGNALAGLKDIDGAIAGYQEALTLNPAADAASANLGAIQFMRGQKEAAEATFTRAVESAPKSVSARMALANLVLGDAQTERGGRRSQGRSRARAGEPGREPCARNLLPGDRPRCRSRALLQGVCHGGQDARGHDQSRRLLHRHETCRRGKDSPDGPGAAAGRVRCSHDAAGGR